MISQRFVRTRITPSARRAVDIVGAVFTTRPELRGTFGMVASTHWLASAAGMAVLEQGGNAFDAAVAAGFRLPVVEPHLNGPGGDLPALLWPAGREPIVLCAQGPAPQAATIARYRDELELKLVPGPGRSPRSSPARSVAPRSECMARRPRFKRSCTAERNDSSRSETQMLDGLDLLRASESQRYGGYLAAALTRRRPEAFAALFRASTKGWHRPQRPGRFEPCQSARSSGSAQAALRCLPMCTPIRSLWRRSPRRS
jgi:Gamma-glutamyltranspeptidase